MICALRRLAFGAHSGHYALVMVDDSGYLVGGALLMSGRQDDGVLRAVFRRDYLESSLWSYGEDDCLTMVRNGLSQRQVYDIGVVDHRLEYTADPDKASGYGYSGDKALALAAVEVLEGHPRPLKRKRRRPAAPQRP